MVHCTVFDAFSKPNSLSQMHDTMSSSMSAPSVLADSARGNIGFPSLLAPPHPWWEEVVGVPEVAISWDKITAESVEQDRPRSSGLQHKWPLKPSGRTPSFSHSAAFYWCWEKEEEPEIRFCPYNQQTFRRISWNKRFDIPAILRRLKGWTSITFVSRKKFICNPVRSRKPTRCCW